MKAGMAHVSYPGKSDRPGAIPGADRQHPSELEPRVEIGDIREYEDSPLYHETPVRVCGISHVNIVPAARSIFRTLALTGPGSPDIAVAGNPKIRRVFLYAAGNPIWVGTQEQVKNGTGPTGGLLPVGIWSPPFEGFSENMWAVATVGAATLTIREEYWAD